MFSYELQNLNLRMFIIDIFWYDILSPVMIMFKNNNFIRNNIVSY